MLRKYEQGGQGRRGTSPSEACPGTSASASTRAPGIYTRGQAGKLELEAGLYTHVKRAGN